MLGSRRDAGARDHRSDHARAAPRAPSICGIVGDAARLPADDVRLADDGVCVRWTPRAGTGCSSCGCPATPLPDYRLRVTFGSGHVVEIDDPYRYGRVLTRLRPAPVRRRHASPRRSRSSARTASASATTVGVHFAVWAPNAERVSVVGDFNGWDGRVHPMRLLVPSGVWELFIPDLADGEKYKFEIRTRTGALLKKSDPFGVAFEAPPQTASVVRDISGYEWRDDRVDGDARRAAEAGCNGRCRSTRCTSARGRACRRTATAS